MIDALNAGAIDVVRKPSALASDDLRKIRDELVDKLMAAAAAPVRNLVGELVVKPKTVGPHAARFDIVVIGISTGGPQALRRMMPMLSADFGAPIAIVLHMPVGYTALYAEKLNELCALEVKEAQDGDELRPGIVLVAQAGRHLGFCRTASGTVVAQLIMQPLEKIHRPSGDVMFRSAAEIYHDRVLAVVMTGMGDDGKEG